MPPLLSSEAHAVRPIRPCYKFLTYHYSDNATPQQIRSQIAWTLDRAVKSGFAPILSIKKRGRTVLEARGRGGGNGEPADATGIRWNLFQLLQATERAEGHGIAARGLTGRTYEGHYFWDTEIYVLPFLIYTHPRIARNILKFRYDMLDSARARAAGTGAPRGNVPMADHQRR